MVPQALARAHCRPARALSTISTFGSSAKKIASRLHDVEASPAGKRISIRRRWRLASVLESTRSASGRRWAWENAFTVTASS